LRHSAKFASGRGRQAAGRALKSGDPGKTPDVVTAAFGQNHVWVM